MDIAIGADHGGFKLKKYLIGYLKRAGHKIFDVGTASAAPCDYPDFAKKVLKLIQKKKAQRGILICKTGLGMCMAANRQKGIRAAPCYNLKAVKSSRQHNDANVLVLGANFVTQYLAGRMSRLFLKTEFEGGRHAERVRKIENTK